MRAWKILPGFALAFLLGDAAGAAYVPLRTDVTGDKPEVVVLNQNAQEVQMEIKLPALEITEGILDGQKWDRVEIPGGGYELDLGAPETPHFTRLLVIPPMAAVHAQLEALETATIPNILLMPAQGKDPLDLTNESEPVEFDQSRYLRNELYPAQQVMVGEPAIMRGCRVVALRANPVQYNPLTRELVITTKFRVTVRFQGQDLRNVPIRQIPHSHAWGRLMKSQSYNYDDLTSDEQNTGSYLIIYQNDASLNTALQPLIDWKNRKGHTVVVQNFPASPAPTTSSIKAIIQNAYNTWPTPPEYILLIGDTGGGYTGSYMLPGWSPSGIDHPYTQLDGGDILADAAIGRFPIQDLTEVQVAVNKVLFYEKMPYIEDPHWFQTGVLCAGSSSSGISTIQTNRWIKNRMLLNNYTRIDTFWYNMGGSSVPTTMTNAINAGVTYCNYRGYMGISGWTNTNIDQLNNGRKLPFCTILTCGTGGFDYDSDMEHFFSVGTPTVPKGAVASIGTATAGTNTRCNNTVAYGVYAGVFDEGITQTGTSLVRGKLELYNTYNTNDPGAVSSFSLWNALAGDPGLELFNGALHYMTCTIPESISLGQGALTLTVNETGIGPVEGATVCFYKSRDLREIGLTDAAGQITLPTNVDSAGNLKVTITKHNFYPIIDSLNVVQAEVAVGYYSHSIDDDNFGGSQGDNDGIINPGEAVQIPTVFKNFGNSTTATGVSVTAAETDNYVTLSNPIQTFPDLVPGATGNSSGSFLLTVIANCPHNHIIPLNLTADAAQGSWPGLLELTVVSYDMTLLSAQASGNDTLLQPGETANLVLTVRNDGAKTAANLMATMISLDSLVIVNDNQAGFGTVATHATANCTANPFNLTASANAAPGREVRLAVTYSANGAVQCDTVKLRLGTAVMTDPQGPDEYGYYCFDDTDVNYAQRPTYNWVEIDPSYGGTGEQLNINDPSENSDVSTFKRTPFTFRFYGVGTNHLTICSNGWISPTPDVSFADFRNYPIPSAVGPTGHICAFWDDLITWGTTPGGHVFWWSDTAGHRLIIEWSHLKNFGTPQPMETFEIIIYDPVYYPTPTGDAEIVFQYNSITEVAGVYDDNKYSTVGIESWDHQDGLEVVYWNTYHDPRTAHLQNGRAYKFSTACTFVSPGLTMDVSLTPVNPPIVIPAQGGTFSFNVSYTNNSGSQVLFDGWIMQYTPLNQWQGPLLGPLHLTVPGGLTVSRQRQQSVPSTAPAGHYTYRAYIGNYLNGTKYDSSSFTYTKSTARDGGATITDWENWGESFAPYLTDDDDLTARDGIPTTFGLEQNRPNPFNPLTAISYQLPASSQVILKVYDLSGRLVRTLVDDWQQAGTHEVSFDGSKLSSGLYFVRMQAADFSTVKKMMLVK